MMPIVIATADRDIEGNLRKIDVFEAFRPLCIQGFLVAAVELGEARAAAEGFTSNLCHAAGNLYRGEARVAFEGTKPDFI